MGGGADNEKVDTDRPSGGSRPIREGNEASKNKYIQKFVWHNLLRKLYMYNYKYIPINFSLLN